MNYFIIIVCALLISSCSKGTDTYANIPNVAVNEYLYLNNPSYANLNAIGGSIYVSAGARGLIVTRASLEDFYAFERTCTYQSSQSCAKVTIDSINPNVAKCNCCTSRFSLFGGSVENGPATLPLLMYVTSYEPTTNVLRINN